MGAWIEICIYMLSEGIADSSHPLWVRGLKSSHPLRVLYYKMLSHPLWVRGLK